MAGASKTLRTHELADWFETAFGDALRNLNWNRPLKAVGLILESHTRENFEHGKSPDGVPWKPLVFARARNMAAMQREQKGKKASGAGPGRPLQDTGILRASLTSRGANHIEIFHGSLLEWGTNVHYGPLHQYGGIVRPKNARALSIPMTTEAARVESARFFPRKLALIWTKGKSHGWLVENKGKGKQKETILHYLLVPKATVPARPFLGLNQAIIDEIKEMLSEEVANQFEKLL